MTQYYFNGHVEQRLTKVKTRQHTSVGRALDLKTPGCGFDSQTGQLTVTNGLSDETLNRASV